MDIGIQGIGDLSVMLPGQATPMFPVGGMGISTLKGTIVVKRGEMALGDGWMEVMRITVDTPVVTGNHRMTRRKAMSGNPDFMMGRPT